MLKKQFASLLICAIALLMCAPPKIFAQTQSQSEFANSKQTLDDGQSLKSDVKKVFAKEMAKVRAGTLSKDTIKRLEKSLQDPQSTTSSKSGIPKKHKALIILILGGIVVLAVVLAITLEDGDKPFCNDAPWDPYCVPL